MVAPLLTLRSGTGLSGLELQVDTLNAQVTGTGGIDLTDLDGGLSAAAITASGYISLVTRNGDLVATNIDSGSGAFSGVSLATQTAGNVRVGRVIASGASIGINSVGSIVEEGSDAAQDLQAVELNLVSNTGIGTAANPLETYSNNINAHANGTGAINLAETALGVNLVNVTTANGGIAVTSADGNLDASLVSATGGGVSLTTTGSGDVRVNRVVATGAVNVTSVANIVELNSDAAADVVSNVDSTLRANGGNIGATNALEVDIAGTLSVLATGQVGGVSIRINGTVSPTNTLLLLNTPPGQVLFNGVPVP